MLIQILSVNFLVEQVLNGLNSRTLNAVIPVLSLNSTTSNLCSMGMNGYKVYTLSVWLIQDLSGHEWKRAAADFALLAISITCIALPIITQQAHFFFSISVFFVSELNTLRKNLSARKWSEAFYSSLKILHQLIHIGSMVYGTHGLLLLSLGLQAIHEIDKALDFAKKDERLSAWVHVFIALFRAHSAQTHVNALHRNWFGKEFSQKDWEIFYSQVLSDREKGLTTHSLDHYLQNGGFKEYIHDVEFDLPYPDFDDPTGGLTGVVFENITLEKCDFFGQNLSNITWINVKATDCNFEESLWINSFVQNSFFNRCNFSSSALIESLIQNTTWANSSLDFTCFNHSTLDNTSFFKSTLLETSFFDTTVRQGRLTDCDLTDTLLLDTKSSFTIKGGIPHQITKPIVALGWHFESTGSFTYLIHSAIRDNGAIPLRYEQYPSQVNGDLLDQEASQFITKYTDESSSHGIPQFILRSASADSQVAKIQAIADSILKHSNGLILPGGEDIPAELYGAKSRPEPRFFEEIFDIQESTSVASDTKRSLLELALIDSARRNSIPTMGICRGSQIINIYFGGTLKDLFSTSSGFSRLEFTDSSLGSWLKEKIQEPFVGLSAHHQAIDRLGAGLHVILEKFGIPKLSVSEDGLFVASQIHPEYYTELQAHLQSGDTTIYYHDSSPRVDILSRIIQQNRLIYEHFIALLAKPLTTSAPTESILLKA